MGVHFNHAPVEASVRHPNYIAAVRVEANKAQGTRYVSIKSS
jgi:hypothetical protein